MYAWPKRCRCRQHPAVGADAIAEILQALTAAAVVNNAARHPRGEPGRTRPVPRLTRSPASRNTLWSAYRADGARQVPAEKNAGSVRHNVPASRRVRQARRRPRLGGGHPAACPPERRVRRACGLHEVAEFRPGTRTFIHPDAGPLAFTTVIQVPGTQRPRRRLHQPTTRPGSTCDTAASPPITQRSASPRTQAPSGRAEPRAAGTLKMTRTERRERSEIAQIERVLNRELQERFVPRAPCSGAAPAARR